MLHEDLVFVCFLFELALLMDLVYFVFAEESELWLVFMKFKEFLVDASPTIIKWQVVFFSEVPLTFN